MAAPRNVVGLAPKGSGAGGRPVVGLAPKGSDSTGRQTVGLAPSRFRGGRGGPVSQGNPNGGGGGIGGFFKKFGSNLYDIAVHTPGGVYHIGKAAVDQAVYGEGSPFHKKGDANTPLTDTALEMGKQVKSDLRHPFRNPGYTLLDVLPVANTGAKVAEAGRLARAGASAGEVGKALVTRPVYEPRTLRHNGLEVKVGSSQSALGHLAQKTGDKLTERLANREPSTTAGDVVQRFAEKHQARKVGRAVQAESRVIQDAHRAKGAALIALGRKFKPAEQKALQVVAEETPLERRITAESARVTGAKTPKARAAHQAELDLLHKAQEHLDVGPDGKPVFAGPQAKKLNYALGRMREVASSREDLLKGLGQLSDESIQSRKTNAGRVALGASYEKPTPGKLGVPSEALTRARGRVARLEQLHERATERAIDRAPTADLIHYGMPAEQNPIVNRLSGALSLAKEDVQRLEAAAAKRVKPTGILGAEDFQASPNAVRVPDVATRRGVRSLGRFGSVGAQGTIGHIRAPGSVTHEYTGALREHAIRRQDTTALVGESGMEAAKYAGLAHVHELVRKAVTAEPKSPTDVAVRLDKIKPSERMPLEVRRFVEDPEEFFKTASPHDAETMFENVRSRVFFQPKKLTGETAAEFQRLKEQGKIGWVPRELLGDLAKPHLPYSGKAIKGVDAINNASRFAILYLKPAYALPNLLGNAALNLLQQGFAAVPNLTRAARLDRTLGPEMAAQIDSLMGEGFAKAISAHGTGIAAAAVDKAARVWSKGVDQPFRRSSFLYEARRLGYKTPAELNTLVNDPRRISDLVEVTQRANREIIDYANLTPTEREVIRRVVFFYPWVKGSTVYSARFLREHPYKAAITGQVGAEGKKHDLATPSYLDGAFDVHGNLVNPTSAAIMQTPAQVGMALASLLGGNVGAVGDLSNFLSPAAAGAVGALTHRDRSGYAYKPGTGIGSIAFDQLVKQTPQYLLGQRISDAEHGRGANRLYPPNVRDALLQYLIGGIAPRRYNPQKLASLAKSDKGALPR